MLMILPVLVGNGCEGTATSRRTDSATSAGVQRLEQTLWSPTLHWNGVRFRFELIPGQKKLEPKFLHDGPRDILSIGDRQVQLIRTRFKVGESLYNWTKESVILIYRIPDRQRPFSRRQGSLQLTWIGDGKNPVVEEQQQDGTIVWTLANARVTRDPQGTVLYQGRGPDLSRSGPWNLLIDARGERVEDSR
ncbi:MAG: hypothetical protein OSB09_03115 [Planctomycetota bacterium]|nr:hypothetical protein [Planctomycetota bacterium]